MRDKIPSATRRSPDGRRLSGVQASLDALRRIVQALRLGAGEGHRRTGLSSAQLFALQQIAEHPSVSINDLAALTFTHQSSVSVVVQRLVAQGLVSKVAAADDRRRQRLALTAKGRRALQRRPEAVQEHLIAAIVALPITRRRQLAQALADVARAVGPGEAAPYPPMLFEEGPPHRGASGSRRTRRA